MWENWSAPRAFIQSNGDTLEIVESTAALVAEVLLPLVVVVIAGVYRTGKSYLMNRLADKETGFPLGNTLQSKTKGIWVWCRPHPYREDCALLLMDTEGLSDPEKGSERNDTQLLCLSILLSSLFTYNAIGRIDNDMIRRLHFITEILDNIAVRERNDDEDLTIDYEELREFLPDFALVVRDFSLDLEINQQAITPDEYFNRVLQLKEGCPRHNSPREAIRRAFRSHRCFVMARPVANENLFCKLESLKETQLTPIFLKQSREFCHFVRTHAETKKMKAQDGQTLNGKVWLGLTREYVATINNDAIPCLESTFASVAERTNIEAIKESMKVYQEEINSLTLPLTTPEVKFSHRLWSKRALCYYHQHSLLDTDRTYRTALKVQLHEALRDLKNENRQYSEQQCRYMLESIYNAIIKPKIQDDSYVCCVNGYKRYKAVLRDLRNQYDYQKISNGCLHTAILQKFLTERCLEKIAIKHAVNVLKIKEKRWHELQHEREDAERDERQRREQAEAECCRLECLQRDNQDEINRAYAEHEHEMNELRRNHERRQRNLTEQQRLKEDVAPHELRNPTHASSTIRGSAKSGCVLQ